MAKRKPIAAQVRQQVLMEAGYKCGNPACRNILTLQLHHIEWVKDHGGNEPSNLLPLCGFCHDQHTNGYIPTEAIRYWKGMLVALNDGFDRGSMDLLLYLAKVGEPEALWYSCDSLLRFAGLITSGLVQFEKKVLHGQSSGGAGNWGPIPVLVHQSSYPIGMVVQLSLTEKGKLLVEAWRKGDERAYRRLIGLADDPATSGKGA